MPKQGERLTKVKKLLPHGEFGKWIDEQFGMSQEAASKFMLVARKFGDEISDNLKFAIAPTILYELASPSFPEETAKELLNGNGTVPTVEGEKSLSEANVADQQSTSDVCGYGVPV